jgi:hypothetical protein
MSPIDESQKVMKGTPAASATSTANNAATEKDGPTRPSRTIIPNTRYEPITNGKQEAAAASASVSSSRSRAATNQHTEEVAAASRSTSSSSSARQIVHVRELNYDSKPLVVDVPPRIRRVTVSTRVLSAPTPATVSSESAETVMELSEEKKAEESVLTVPKEEITPTRTMSWSLSPYTVIYEAFLRVMESYPFPSECYQRISRTPSTSNSTTSRGKHTVFLHQKHSLEQRQLKDHFLCAIQRYYKEEIVKKLQANTSPSNEGGMTIWVEDKKTDKVASQKDDTHVGSPFRTPKHFSENVQTTPQTVGKATSSNEHSPATTVDSPLSMQTQGNATQIAKATTEISPKSLSSLSPISQTISSIPTVRRWMMPKACFAAIMKEYQTTTIPDLLVRQQKELEGALLRDYIHTGGLQENNDSMDTSYAINHYSSPKYQVVYVYEDMFLLTEQLESRLYEQSMQ